MRPLDCQSCYVAAERNGVLVQQLRKAASRLHLVLGHTARDFWHCHRDPCPDNAAAIEGRPIARPTVASH